MTVEELRRELAKYPPAAIVRFWNFAELREETIKPHNITLMPSSSPQIVLID